MNLLYSPPHPLIDFVFVHGLGGGSRKTWNKSGSSQCYWPQDWLPNDPDFKNVRIHSFGYDSDWAKAKGNCLDIHHFARSLLGTLMISPCLGRSNTPIVFICHSMGGLVTKKAYVLARQESLYKNLAERFQAIYFLATPHRGSDSAKLLANVLQMAYSSRAYVTDIKRGSKMLQTINTDFGEYASALDLWSLYETHKISLGMFSALIVDPDSATLGYPHEKQIPMNADHRSICKFATPMDSNYATVRNALLLTVNNLSELGMWSVCTVNTAANPSSPQVKRQMSPKTIRRDCTMAAGPCWIRP